MSPAAGKSAFLKTVLILCIALALRSAFLSKESLWLDELDSWWLVTGPWARTLGGEPTNPPLYLILLRFWVSFFGVSEAALRAFSIPFSVAAVWLTCHLGKRVFCLEVGLVAAAYQAISSFHVYYAQEARTHAMLLFLILLSTLLLLRLFEARSPRRALVLLAAYVLTITASLYAHFITVFFLAAHGLWVLARRPRDLAFLAKWTAAAATALLLFFPWLKVMLATAAGGGQPRRHLWLKPPQTFFSLLFGDTLVPLDEAAVRNVAGTLRDYAAPAAAALLAALILLPFAWAAFRRWREGGVLVAIMGVAPVLLCFAVSFRVLVIDERYMLSCSPFLYLGVAAASWEIWRRARSRPLRLPALAGLIALAGYSALLLLSLYNYYFAPRFGKEQWRQAVALLDARTRPSDLILFEPDYLRHGYNYYRRCPVAYLPLTDPLLEQTLAGDPQILARLRGHDRVWLVRSHYRSDRLLQLLRRMGDEQERFFFPRAREIEIYRFTMRP